MSLKHACTFLLLILMTGLSVGAEDVVFKSDVAMTRVDAQVVDRSGRAVTGLQINDFVLRMNGKVLPIRKFASENMPIDIVLLLDVSGSMQPHVERIASAAHQALNVLADKDRIAIMVFDTSARVRLPFQSDHVQITKALNHLLRSEGFNGGTRITSAMLSAAHYLDREARPDARRAVVILTDDETQDSEDEARVEQALAHANAVLSFLQAPYDVPTMGGGGSRRHRTWGGGGGGFPGGGGIGFPGGGGVGFPGGGGVGFPGRGGPGGYGGDRSHTAGTATIAQDSGGDTMQVDDASALEDTLARLRQRYALFFYLPEGLKSGEPKSVNVALAQDASIRYHDAEVRSRQVFMSGAAGHANSPVLTSTEQEPPASGAEPASSQSRSGATPGDTEETAKPGRRGVAVNEDSAPRINTVDPDADSSGSQANPTSDTAPAAPAPHSGWPRADGQSSKPQ